MDDRPARIPTAAEWRRRRRSCVRRRRVFVVLIVGYAVGLAVAINLRSVWVVVVCAVGLGLGIGGRIITDRTVRLIDVAVRMTEEYESGLDQWTSPN